MLSTFRPTIAFGATACALVLLAAPAAAVSAKSSLTLSLQDNSRILANVVTLRCEPSGGTHPRAQEACTAIESASGDIEGLQTTGMACPMVYQPVTAEARGRWQGKNVRFQHTFANRCVAAAETEDVFRF
jgi:hypothetical protein